MKTLLSRWLRKPFLPTGPGGGKAAARAGVRL